jgi:hypothetical protein
VVQSAASSSAVANAKQSHYLWHAARTVFSFNFFLLSRYHRGLTVSGFPTLDFKYLNKMAEPSSTIDSSFVLIGAAEQSQVLPPSRPSTVTSDATFPSSISTPTSPIDSNVSSVGTLEVFGHPSPYFSA